MALPFRPGIAVRLHVLLSALLAAMLVSSAFAVFTLRGLERQYEDIASAELATVIAAHRISQDSESIAGQAPLLALADNPVTLRTITLRLSDQLSWLRREIAALNEAGVTAARVQSLIVREQALSDALGALGDAVRRRIEDEHASRLTAERLSDLGQRLAEAHVSTPDTPVVSAFTRQADLALRIAFAIQGTWTPADLDRSAGALRGALDEAATAFTALPIAEARAFTAPWEALRALAEPPGDIVTQRRNALGSNGRVAGALYGARAAAEDLAAASSSLVAEVERTVATNRAAVSAEADTDTALLLIAVLLALGLATTVFLYVRRAVAARLRAVQASVLAHVRGEHQPIPASGDDEIGDIGRAFAYFVDEVAIRQRALGDSERQFREALESAPFPIVLAETGTFAPLFANHAAQAAFGQQAQGASVLDLFTQGADRSAVAMALEGITPGTPSRPLPASGAKGLEVHLRQADGAEFWALLSSTGVRFMGRPAWLFTFYDVTRLKDAETRLTRLVGDLERSNADLEQFAYVASHDLREPLRMVASYLTLLRRRYDTVLDDQGREFVTFAVQGAQRMDRLILDLLEFSRVGRGNEGPGPVDLGQVVRQALANLAVAVAESGAVVEVAPGLPVVEGREGDLIRLFQNLIANALRYREPSRTPHLSITCGRVDGEWRLSVRDNGIGIADMHRERIFLLFQRLHPRSADGEGGTGIGLAVCRKVVETHGGRIWVESQEGIGSTFLFTLPVSGSQAGAMGGRFVPSLPPPVSSGP